MKNNYPRAGRHGARAPSSLDRRRPLRLLVIFVLLLASGMAGCLGESDSSSSPTAPGSAGWHQSSHYGAIDGGLAVTFAGPVSGSVAMYAANVTFPFAPFAIQAHWIPLGNRVESLVYGYELEFRHQLEGELLSAGAGEMRAGTPILEGAPVALAGATLDIDQDGPGHLIVAWANLPEGLHIQSQLNVTPSEIRSVEIDFVEITELGSGAFAFTPVGRLAASEKVTEATGRDLVFFKYLVPSNAGAGDLRVSAPNLEWQDELRSANTTCIDCFERRAYLGVVEGPWSMEVTYAGRSGNFQGFVTVVHLRDLEAESSTTFYPASPCADIFACR